jgi:VanZ family protein
MTQRAQKWFYIAPLVAWMLIIFFSSSDAGNADNTHSLIRRLIELISPEQARNISSATLNVVNLVVRKAAHVTEYAILTLLAVRAIQWGEPTLKRSAFFGAFFLSAAYACGDEFHQRFVASRSSSPIDVAIDLAGITLVMVGMTVFFALKKWERRLHSTE